MASTAPTSSGTAPATATATAAPKQASAATVADRDDDNEDRASGTGLGVPMHAIHKGRLFLGNLRAARDKSLLQEHGITHVLSVVPAKAPFPKVLAHSQIKNHRKLIMHGCCCCCQDFVYCLVPFEDEPGASLFANLRACIDFMTTTLAKDDTKLLVHWYSLKQHPLVAKDCLSHLMFLFLFCLLHPSANKACHEAPP